MTDIFIVIICELNLHLAFLLFVHFNPSFAKHDMPCFANNVDPDQLSSKEANWSEAN